MNHVDRAEELFNSGYNCAQSVVCAFCDEIGVDFETALKLSSSFGAGMGMLREVCGALTGAFMVAGFLWGYSDKDDPAKKTEHYALIRRIAEEFKEKNTTYICKDLLANLKNISMSNPAKRNAEYYASRPCCRFVGDAAEILDRIIAEKADK
jgi:C_GCAxxG_C_C family probable redox protein